MHRTRHFLSLYDLHLLCSSQTWFSSRSVPISLVIEVLSCMLLLWHQSIKSFRKHRFSFALSFFDTPNNGYVIYKLVGDPGNQAGSYMWTVLKALKKFRRGSSQCRSSCPYASGLGAGRAGHLPTRPFPSMQIVESPEEVKEESRVFIRCNSLKASIVDSA